MRALFAVILERFERDFRVNGRFGGKIKAKGLSHQRKKRMVQRPFYVDRFDSLTSLSNQLAPFAADLQEKVQKLWVTAPENRAFRAKSRILVKHMAGTIGNVHLFPILPYERCKRFAFQL